MIEQQLNIKTRDGDMSTFITHPERGGPHPVVILYMDAPGIREELRDMARRIATVGYYCVLPNLFYRWGGPSFATVNRDAQTQQAMLDTMGKLSNAMVVEDTRHILAYTASQAAASKGPVGCTGYCMSGQFVLTLMGTLTDHFVAGASLHGVKHVTDKPDSPHLLADRIKGELYFGFASDDPHVPPAEVEALRKVLAEKRVAHEIEIHPQTQHGYVFPQRPVYNKAAAERQWERVFALFERKLKKAAARAA
ncbi:MAG: dienelactone hydrolase family protein [Candidatus Lambdaproteobacteria bacterium]|nr:dienelactone hydrolase family protein [Candidatus Lambdaproteobacteria bacterium]